MAGKCSRASTALTIVATVLAAASGLCWEMYSDTAIRFARAARSQLTRTSRQAPDRLLHFLFAGKVTGVGLAIPFLISLICHSFTETYSRIAWAATNERLRF